MYSPKKSQIITSIALGALGIIIFIVFVILNFLSMGQVDQNILKENETAHDIEKVLSIKKQMVDYKSDIAVLDSFFVQPGEEAFFIESIEKLARSHNLKVETQSIAIDSKANKDFEIMSMTVNFEGSLYNINQFLKNLEEAPQAVAIRSVEENTTPGGGQSWSGAVALSVYKIKSQ